MQDVTAYAMHSRTVPVLRTIDRSLGQHAAGLRRLRERARPAAPAPGLCAPRRRRRGLRCRCRPCLVSWRGCGRVCGRGRGRAGAPHNHGRPAGHWPRRGGGPGRLLRIRGPARKGNSAPVVY